MAAATYGGERREAGARRKNRPSRLPPSASSQSRRWPSWSDVGAHAILILWAVITLFPIAWVFASSVKTPEQIFELPPAWIFRPTPHNFEVVLGLTLPTELETVTAESAGQIETKFPRYLLNSVVVAIG